MLRRFLWFCLTLTILSAAALLFFQPAIVAIACPSCMGFERVGGNVYVNRAMPAGKRIQVVAHLGMSISAVETFFGELSAHPMIFACSTEECYRRLGVKTARGAAFGAVAIRLSPRGLDNAIAIHELAHIELHARLGMWTTMRRLPAWFDEGLAVLVSDDPRYLGPPAPTDMSGNDVRQLVSPGQWLAASGKQGRGTYASAYREVKAWYDRAGRTGLDDLIQKLREGQRFEDAFKAAVPNSSPGPSGRPGGACAASRNSSNCSR
ncbi:MAG: hypothetical protein OEU46_15010 [Alphaproteobacteria bacterium]|nr:hypothetical protein [Alphaproteobacteria bacterium]